MAEGIDGAVPEYLDPPSGCRFHPRCPYAHETCIEERPEMIASSTEASFECVLYDDRQVAPYDAPTLEDTRDRMGTLADRSTDSTEVHND